LIKETMNAEERLEAAANLEYPDRVPVIPQIFQFALKQRGLPVLSMAGGDPRNWPANLQAAKDNRDDLGGYDGVVAAGLGWPISSWRINSVFGKFISPGEEGTPKDFEVQYAETESIKFEDYSYIIDKGWNEFLKVYVPRETERSIEQLDAAEKLLTSITLNDQKYYRERHIPIMSGALLISCEMTLALARTLPKFMMDVHRHPDVVKAAMDAMTPDFIDNNLKDIEVFKVPWVDLPLERGSGAYFALKTYEELFFPQLKRQVEAFWEHGIRSVVHCDTDWTKNLPYFRELPTKSCVFQFDSTTDIFKAKEVLGGHMCIMGDVSASLLSLGNKEEVIAYCENLIDICGKDGGFVLSSGCEVPPDAKFENVKAMIDTAKTYAAARSRRPAEEQRRN
jgi:uroporphyrinogen-III decarboxylase